MLVYAISSLIPSCFGLCFVYIFLLLLWSIVQNFFVQYCKEQQNHHVLVDMYYQYDQFLDSGNLYVQDSYAEKVGVSMPIIYKLLFILKAYASCAQDIALEEGHAHWHTNSAILASIPLCLLHK